MESNTKYELRFCKNCIQMTNHNLFGRCLKCNHKPLSEAQINFRKAIRKMGENDG